MASTTTTFTPNALVTLDGVSTQVYIAGDTSIVDPNGHSFTIPDDVKIHPDGTLWRNDKQVGQIAPISSSTPSTNPDGSPTSSTTGSGSTITSATLTTDTTSTAAAAGAAAGGTPAPTVPQTDTFGGTRNLDDGGARILASVNPNGGGPDSGGGVPDLSTSTTPPGDLPNTDPAIDPTPTDPGGGGGDPGPQDTNPTPTPTPDPTPNPGPWGENNPQHDAAPAGTYDPLPPEKIDTWDAAGQKAGSSMAGIGLLAYQIQRANSGGLATTLLNGRLGSVVGVAGIALGAWGTFSSVLDMLRNGANAGNIINLAMGVVGVMTGVAIFAHSTIMAVLLGSNPWGWIIIAAMVAIAFIWNHRPKRDNDLDSSKGDVEGDLTNLTAPTPPAWAQANLPVQSVFMILAGVTTLGLGFNFNPMDLTSNGPYISQEVIPPSMVPAFTQSFTKTLQKATNTTITGGLLGKIFIKAGDGLTPDKVTYMTEFTNDDPNDKRCAVGQTCQAVTMVALNPSGNVVSEIGPSDKRMLQPFFAVSGGVTKPNPAAFNALGNMTALVQVPQGGGSAKGAMTAVNMAGLWGHSATQVTTQPNQ